MVQNPTDDNSPSPFLIRPQLAKELPLSQAILPLKHPPEMPSLHPECEVQEFLRDLGDTIESKYIRFHDKTCSSFRGRLASGRRHHQGNPRNEEGSKTPKTVTRASSSVAVGGTVPVLDIVFTALGLQVIMMLIFA
ncbi:hypothetical protein EG329_004762 [Mollisiaceae sp. DMI_Dod_QoI]|nr:hypothetical protein EG329_004762 [Helotiales sp. DMI_Dod_QoI]